MTTSLALYCCPQKPCPQTSHSSSDLHDDDDGDVLVEEWSAFIFSVSTNPELYIIEWSPCNPLFFTYVIQSDRHTLSHRCTIYRINKQIPGIHTNIPYHTNWLYEGSYDHPSVQSFIHSVFHSSIILRVKVTIEFKSHRIIKSHECHQSTVLVAAATFLH